MVYMYRSVKSGQAEVATAGTPVALDSSDDPVGVARGTELQIRANPGNIGTVFVGGSEVSSTSGYVLDPGAEVSLKVKKPSTVMLDAVNVGDGVSWLCSTEAGGS